MSGEIVGKSITLVELDLDAYRITQFEAARDGAPVARWTSRWGPNTTLLGEVPAPMPSGRAARVTHGVGNRSLWSWDAITPDLKNASAVALVRFNGLAGNEQIGIVLRGSGGDGTDTGYILRLQGGAGLNLVKRVVGVSTFPASTSSQ